MKLPRPFATRSLDGRPPAAADGPLYHALFGRDGAAELQRNLQDFERLSLSPWTLSSDGRDVGVGGFRLGLGDIRGFELLLNLVPGPLPVGLAGEFLSDALLFARAVLRADRLYSLVHDQTALSPRMLIQSGFSDEGLSPTPARPDQRVMGWDAPSPPSA